MTSAGKETRAWQASCKDSLRGAPPSWSNPNTAQMDAQRKLIMIQSSLVVSSRLVACATAKMPRESESVSLTANRIKRLRERRSYASIELGTRGRGTKWGSRRRRCGTFGNSGLDGTPDWGSPRQPCVPSKSPAKGERNESPFAPRRRDGPPIQGRHELHRGQEPVRSCGATMTSAIRTSGSPLWFTPLRRRRWPRRRCRSRTRRSRAA